MREQERLALGQVGLDVFLVALGLFGVRQAHHDHVCAAYCLGGVIDLEAFLFGYAARLAALVETDDDLAPAFLEVKRVRVALATEPEHGQGFTLEVLQVRVFISVYFCCHCL